MSSSETILPKKVSSENLSPLEKDVLNWVVKAISDLKGRDGSSSAEIKKYLKSKHSKSEIDALKLLNPLLKNAVQNEKLTFDGGKYKVRETARRRRSRKRSGFKKRTTSGSRKRSKSRKRSAGGRRSKSRKRRSKSRKRRTQSRKRRSKSRKRRSK